jgi:uncharacterized protein (UPF0179 family)
MITLIGTSLAVEGLEFMHQGTSSQCENCRFKNTCIDNLEEDRIYVITEVKDTQHPCPIHEGGKVTVVNVERSDIEVLIDCKRAFEGSNIIFKPNECDFDCSLKDQCFPDGLHKEDRCKIMKNIGKPAYKCPKGLNLCLVRLKF